MLRPAISPPSLTNTERHPLPDDLLCNVPNQAEAFHAGNLPPAPVISPVKKLHFTPTLDKLCNEPFPTLSAMDDESNDDDDDLPNRLLTDLSGAMGNNGAPGSRNLFRRLSIASSHSSGSRSER